MKINTKKQNKEARKVWNKYKAQNMIKTYSSNMKDIQSMETNIKHNTKNTTCRLYKHTQTLYVRYIYVHLP